MDRTKLSLLLTIPLLAVAALVVPLWLQGEIPVFRDAGHYYYPSFHFEHRLWQQGSVPLWSHLDDLGRPFVADSSTSVFYPGKLLFWLPFSFSSCVLLYLAAHLILAGLNTFQLARRWGASPAGGTLAGLSFCMGGAVLTQHSNIIYLVSAAWLPLALCLALDILDKNECRKSIAYFAVTLALMVLGGEPQMALHVILLVPLLYLFAGKKKRSEYQAKGITKRRICRCLAMSGLLAFGLAAIQILPTYQWTKQANRNLRSTSRTTFEWASDRFAGKEFPNHILKGGSKNDHHGQLYQFSLAPWQLPELALPNLTGKLYPQRHRWTFLLEDNPRTWYPSIYQGILALLLALSVFGIGRNANHKQISRLTLFTILASFGSFGIGWLITAIGGTNSAAPETGGVYWFLCNVIPGYIQFRYPAKWFVIASLLIAILAGLGLDAEDDDSRRRKAILNWTIIGLCCSLLACFPLISRTLTRELSKAPPDAFLGPALSAGSKQDLLLAALQPLVIVVGFILVTRIIRHKKVASTLILIILASDLYLANAWIFSSAPAYHWDAISPLETVLKNSTQKMPPRVYRARLSRWNPPSFAKEGSADRQRDALAWDRQSLRPRLHLLSHIQLIDANASISDANYDSVLRVLRSYGKARNDRVREPDIKGLALLGASHIIGPADFYPASNQELTKATSLEDVAITTTAAPSPFLWTVPNWTVRPEFQSGTPAELDQITREIYYPQGVIADFQKRATLESDLLTNSDSEISIDQDIIQLVSFEPGFIRIRVFKENDGPLIINQGYDSGWQARIWDAQNTLPQATKLIRANRIMQAVMLKKGEQTIDLVYRPVSFLTGLGISGICWLILCGSLCYSRIRMRAR